jgi:hypothetical protein
MASYGCDTDLDEAQQSKWSTVMGSETRKAQCTTLYVCDSNTEEHSIKLRSILGVLPCSIMRIWRLWARTKNEYTMDDFSMLTIREPWLLEKNFYFYRFHLASRKRNRCYKVVEIHGKEPICQRFPIDHYKERKAKDRVHNLLYERWLQVGTSRNNLAHTFTYFTNFEVLTTRCFESAILFKVDAMHMLVRYGAHNPC